MASAKSDANVTAISSEADRQSGESYQGKRIVGASDAQRGNEGIEAPRVIEQEENVNRDDDLMKALSDTNAEAGGETDEALARAQEFFYPAGLDDSSLMLVTRKLMNNMLRKKPAVSIINVGAEERVAVKFARSKFVAREVNNANLVASRWDQNKLIVHPIMSGETVDTLVPIDFPRTVKVSNLSDAVYQLLSSDIEQEKMADNFDLHELSEDKVLEVMASGFIKTGADYVDEIIKRSLRGEPQEGGLQLKDKLLSLRNHADMVAYVRELGLVKDGDFKVIMQNMTIADLVTVLIEETSKALETAIESYALICNSINKKETTNCRLFKFTCVGSTMINAKIGTTKNFKLSIDGSTYLSQLIVSLRCLENRGRVSILKLEVIGDVMLDQRAVVKLYSGLYRSTGVIDATTEEVIAIQDDVFEGFMTADLIDFADTTEDYTVTNASSLVPMMVLGGIVPDNLEDPATNICWQISLRSVVNNLCRLNRVFDTSIDRNHFLFNFKTALVISCGLNEIIEIKKFIVQFFLWARFVDKSSNLVYTDYFVNSLVNKKKILKVNPGLGAQCLWVASALLEMNEICETGYRYLPIIIFYNMLCSGEYSAKLVNMGVWLANSLNLNTDRVTEDRKLMETMEKLGVRVNVDWKRRLAMQQDIGSKIAVSIEMMREQLRDIVPIVTGTSCTKTEAMLLCKFALMDLDASESASDKTVTDYVSEVSDLVADKMKNCAEQGEMSNEDYLMLIKELTRDMEDDDEMKQVLNTEGTKYHMLCDRLSEKRDEMAGTATVWRGTEVGMAPSSLRRKEMERQLIRDFTNQTVAFSEKARNNMYQLTDFNSTTMRDTLSLNGAIITSFLHRMGNLGGKDINILLSKLAGKGVEGTSASLSAGDVNLLSMSSLETNDSVRGESSSQSSTTKLTVLEGLSITVGISKTFDMVKILESINKLTKQKSVSSDKLNERLKYRDEMKLLQSSQAEDSGRESEQIVVADNKQLIGAYFSSLLQEFKECFEILEFDDDEPAFALIKSAMLLSAGAPMSCVNCVTVIIRRLTDLVWDFITCLYDEMDESSKEAERRLSEEGQSKTRRAAKLSVETLKVALSTALISYKVTFTTYFSIAEGTVSIIKRLCIKLSRKLYLLLEQELVFFEFFVGFSTDVTRVRKYVHGRKRVLCEHVRKDYASTATAGDDSTEISTLSKIESAACIATKPVRVINRLIAAFVNRTYNSCVLFSCKLLNFLSSCKSKIGGACKYSVDKMNKHVRIMMSSFRVASKKIIALAETCAPFKKNNMDKGKKMAESSAEEDPGAPVVSACGMPETSASGERRAIVERARVDVDGRESNSASRLDVRLADTRSLGETVGSGMNQAEASAGGTEAAVNPVDSALSDGDQAVLRIIISRENRFSKFVRVIATRIVLIGRILLEEWADTIEDVAYLVFSRTGYVDRYNIIRLSTELDAGSVGDYERRLLAEEAKRGFYFRAYKATYRTTQRLHDKFVCGCETVAYALCRLKKILENLVSSTGRNVMYVLVALRRRFNFWFLSEESNTLSESLLSSGSDSEESSSRDGSVDRNSSSRRTSSERRNENDASSNTGESISKGNGKLDCSNVVIDENVNLWLLHQDERHYEPSSYDELTRKELQEAREAYFSYLQSGAAKEKRGGIQSHKNDHNPSTRLKNEAAADTTRDVERENASCGKSSNQLEDRDNATTDIVMELKARISEVVWMREASDLLKSKFDSTKSVNWVLSSVGNAGDKHLMRYVGDAEFNKLIVIKGKLDDLTLASIEAGLNRLISQGNCCWTDARFIELIIRRIEVTFGVSTELIDEEDLDDKLAEMIAKEFECRISDVLRRPRQQETAQRSKNERVKRARGNRPQIHTGRIVRDNEREIPSTGKASGKVESETGRVEQEVESIRQGYVRYEESPIVRLLGRLATMTGLSPERNSGEGSVPAYGNKFGISTDKSASGLRLALEQDDESDEDECCDNLPVAEQIDVEATAPDENSSLIVTLTGNEGSSSIASEMLKMLTKSLRGNLVSYMKSWVNAESKLQDNIVIKSVENQGQLSRDDEREIRLRGNTSFATIWDTLDDVLSFAVECNPEKVENNLVEIFGKKRFLKHGKQHDNIKYLVKKEIDIIDAGDVSILCLPLNVNVMKENLTRRGKYSNKSTDEYTCSMKAVCDVTAGKPQNKVMKGKSCVIRNESLGVEMLMLPSHLNAYGRNLPASDAIDALDCLALSNIDSAWLMTPKQLLLDAEQSDEDAAVSGILARQEFDTSSEYFSIVSVDAVDWRGKSGAPIVDSKGAFLGIILMQITDGKYFNVLNEAGIIICAKPNMVARPILHTANVRVAKCPCCNSSGAKRSNKAKNGGELSDSGSDASGLSGGRKAVRREAVKTSGCIECAIVNEERERRRNAGQLESAVLSEGQALCDNCLKEKDAQSRASFPSRGKRLLRAGYNFLIGASEGGSRSVISETDVLAKSTGAMERIGEILARERTRRIDAGASDEVVIHNISEILYYSDQRRVDNLTKTVLEFVLEQLVKGRKPVIVCCTNSCYLTVMLLISALRLRFDRVRSVSELQKACSHHYKKTRTSVVMVNNEDMACSALSKEQLSLSCQHYKVSCLVLTSDNEAVKNCSLVSLKILGLFLTNMTVIMYDCRKLITMTDENPTSAAEKLNCLETKRMDTYQNSGVFHHLQLSNSTIENAELNGLSEDNEDAGIRYVVITMCSNAHDYNTIKKRLSRAIEVSDSAILITSHGAFSSKQTWEVIKTCKNIYLHTGSKVTYASELIVNCSLETEMALCEKKMFLEAYRIASKLSMDADYNDDTIMNVVTLKDMTSETRVDKRWFLVDYRQTNTTKDYCTMDLLKKINLTFIEGSTVVQMVSVIENKFKALRTDDDEITIDLADEDLINENLILKKRVKKPLSVELSMRIDRAASSVKWIWHSATIGMLMFARRLKDYIIKKITRCKYVFKAKVIKSMARMKAAGKRIVVKAFSSLKVNKTASYYNQSNGALDSSIATRTLSSLYRCAGLANVAASVVGHKRRSFGDEKRMDNSIIALMIGAGFETVSCNLADGVRKALESAGNLIATISSVGELAYLILGWKKDLIIGNWRISSCGLSANKVIISKLKQVATVIGREINGIEVVQTGLIIDDVRSNQVSVVTYLNMYELGLSLYEIARKMWLSVRLSWLFSSLRKGIEYRNEHPLPVQRSLEVVPCYEIGEAVSSVILIGATSIIALSLALRRVETAVSTIAVITEKKHTYDMVEVYKKDRDLGAVLFRTASVGYGIFLLSTGNQVSCIVGAVSLCLGIADVMTNSFSELGVCYSLSHVLVRMYTARNKVRAALNGWSAWYGGGSTVANGLNALIITGLIANYGEEDVSSVVINNIKLKMALAQNKERLANGVLMDKTVKSAEAYDNAKMIVLGRRSVDDLSDAVRWDHERGASAEVLDLSLIATRGLGSNDWRRTNSVLVTLGDLTTNQCRFVGRTKKLLKLDKQMMPDEMTEHQSSVLALHDELWRNVISDEDREGWGAAGDSRYAVLLAIAERNDSPIMLSINEELMERMVSRGVELINKIIPETLKVKCKAKSLDWLTVVSNINERATSGILTRLRTGQQVTAGYLPHYGYRSELLCEMMRDDTMPDECSIINVFAKRRVEKKKLSRLTGVECVITRTIQANEVDLKVACAGSFVMLDKMIKLTKCHNGLAIGLNFFIEFAIDELNTSAACYKHHNNADVRRISLDHSSFDSSQRNWSITLCRELRKLANEQMMLNNDREIKEANYVINKIYDGLLIRLMLTTHGDLFAVTGQQMSGHATTSSDNSIKAYLYAMVVCDLLKKSFKCELIANSLRAQGDDTKFDVIIDSDEIDDKELSASISNAMSKLGQVVKSEKIEVLRIGESSSFLSNKCGLAFFKIRRRRSLGESWYESHLIPVRKRKDLIAMLATILKSSSSMLKRKTKKNVSLLAAKSMSFLTMYVGDALVTRVCVTVIWICFKVLTKFKDVSSKLDITSTHLPWFVEQSGIEGEFEIKLYELMSMHGIARKELEVMPEYWIIDKLDPDYDMVQLPQQLMKNARIAFPAIRDWEDDALLDAIKISEVTENNRLMKVCVASVDNQLNKIKGGLTLSIIDATVPYEPFNRLKRNVKGDRIFISNLGLKKVFIIPETDIDEKRICDEVLAQMERPISEDIIQVDLTTKDGLVIKGLKLRIATCKDYKIGIVNKEIEARMIEANSWNIINLACVTMESAKAILSLGKERHVYQSRGIVVTDLNLLNSHGSKKELDDDLNKSLVGASLERLSKLKLTINDERKNTTRNILIVRTT